MSDTSEKKTSSRESVEQGIRVLIQDYIKENDISHVEIALEVNEYRTTTEYVSQRYDPDQMRIRILETQAKVIGRELVTAAESVRELCDQNATLERENKLLKGALEVSSTRREELFKKIIKERCANGIGEKLDAGGSLIRNDFQMLLSSVANAIESAENRNPDFQVLTKHVKAFKKVRGIKSA